MPPAPGRGGRPAPLPQISASRLAKLRELSQGAATTESDSHGSYVRSLVEDLDRSLARARAHNAA